jgi:hypothetical protein
MKLKPTQMVGLAAIIIFGGGMIFRMTQPSEREIMEKRLASLPTISAPTMEFPMPDLPSVATVTPPDLALGAGSGTSTPSAALSMPGEPDYLAIGSQAAKDDLYCSGVLGAEFDAKIAVKFDPNKPETHPDKITPLMDMQKKLDTAGIAKLKAEGLTDGGNWANFTLPYGDKAEADYKANALRIPVTTCVDRASKLPPGTLY